MGAIGAAHSANSLVPKLKLGHDLFCEAPVSL